MELFFQAYLTLYLILSLVYGCRPANIQTACKIVNTKVLKSTAPRDMYAYTHVQAHNKNIWKLQIC